MGSPLGANEPETLRITPAFVVRHASCCRVILLLGADRAVCHANRVLDSRPATSSSTVSDGRCPETKHTWRSPWRWFSCLGASTSTSSLPFLRKCSQLLFPADIPALCRSHQGPGRQRAQLHILVV